VDTAGILERFDRQMRRDAADADGIHSGGSWNARAVAFVQLTATVPSVIPGRLPG